MNKLKYLTKRVFSQHDNTDFRNQQSQYPVPRRNEVVSRTDDKNIRPSLMLDHGCI